jgi:hypothetical protein
MIEIPFGMQIDRAILWDYSTDPADIYVLLDLGSLLNLDSHRIKIHVKDGSFKDALRKLGQERLDDCFSEANKEQPAA